MRMRLDLLVPGAKSAVLVGWQKGQPATAYQQQVHVHHQPGVRNRRKYYVFQFFPAGSAVQVWKVLTKVKKKRGSGYLKNGKAVRLPKRFAELLKSWYIMEGLRTP